MESRYTVYVFNIITTRLRSTSGGYDFTGVSVGGGGGELPTFQLIGRGVPEQEG